MEKNTVKTITALKIGAAYHIRTVSDHWTGKLAALDKDWLVLSDAAWIADTGRFAQFLANGKANEVEPCPDLCYISRAAVCAVIPWGHALPRAQQ